MDLKYPDKKYLNKYDLSIELFKNYDFKVKDLFPLRSVYILDTDKGRKILKKLDYSIERLLFIQEALEYVNNTYPRVMGFYKNIEGKAYTTYKEQDYVVMNMLEGRECELWNPVDISIVAEGIGKLHKASRGFYEAYKKNHKEPLDNHNIKLGKTLADFREALNSLETYSQRVEGYCYKNKFDILFSDNIQYYRNQVEEAIEVLENSSFTSLIEIEDKISLCHNDLAHHNMIIKDEEAYFIDFDYCVIDLKIRDLANYINKSIKNCVFDFQRAKNIIYDYKKSNTLKWEEIEVLYGFLIFPQDFYSLCRDYYEKKKDWEEEVFIDRLRKRIEAKMDREEFLQQFREYYLDNKI